MGKMKTIEEKILKIIAKYSVYSYEDIKNAYKKCKSFDIIIEAIEASLQFNISLEMAIMSSPVNIKRTEREKEN